MKEYIILIIKGIIIGLGKIIPGVSGSLLAMSLGVYEKTLYKIRYFKESIKENMIYFIFLGIGILISIIFGSKIILYFLNNYYVLTIFLFIGLILGIVPSVYKKVKVKDKKYYIATIITILLTILLLNIENKTTFIYKDNIISNIQVMVIGFIEAFTMIVPGISGTAIFLILGYYEFIMNLFSNITSFILNEPLVIILFFISFLLSVYLVSIFINYMLLKHEKITYGMILGFGYSSIFLLIKEVLPKVASPTEMITSIFLILIGFITAKKFE